MIDQDTLSIAEWLRSFGFKPSTDPTSDNGLGFSYKCGNFELTASFVRSKYFQDIVLFLGVLSTSRTLAYVKFEMPRQEMSREKAAAWIVWHLDRVAAKKGFVPTSEAAWLDLGRQNKNLLPWEIKRAKAEEEAAAYDARPKCMIERRWMKLALHSLAEALAVCTDNEKVLFDFNGQALKITCAGKNIVMGAEGNAWQSSYALAAGTLRALPKRLMSPHIDVSVWNRGLRIGRCVYGGVEELPRRETGE